MSPHQLLVEWLRSGSKLTPGATGARQLRSDDRIPALMALFPCKSAHVSRRLAWGVGGSGPVFRAGESFPPRPGDYRGRGESSVGGAEPGGNGAAQWRNGGGGGHYYSSPMPVPWRPWWPNAGVCGCRARG